MLKKIKSPFPNYFFARLHIELHYYKVEWTRGGRKILKNGGGLLPISERVIEAIRERKKCNIVQVTSGSLKDLRGIFLRKMLDRGQVRILLSLIVLDVPVHISQ